ncbi:hypothetical protein SAMN05216364_10202 [Porphyromonadaceae bacterium KHP3R9]|nr:hypothetical protein SAMN05216364_10202 [Porphyromonadaceae bacterium KHP3R9]
MVKLNSLLLIVVLALVTGCDRVKVNPGNTTTWQEQLEQSMALLGHRNWIVVTDMAYPLQARNGITTLFAEEPYMEVLSHVSDLIDSSPHLYAHVCLDRELSDLNESLCPGIENFRKEHRKHSVMPVFDSMISWSKKVDFQKPPKHSESMWSF